MNVEILLDVITELREQEDLYPIAANLDQVVNSLQALTSNPQDSASQQSLSENFARLEEHVKDRETDLEPDKQERLEEIGGLEFFTREMTNRIKAAISDNPMSPAAALSVAKNIQNVRASFIETLGSVEDGLHSFGFSAIDLEPGDAEIGFEIPREIFENQLAGFIDEMRVVKFISDTASLLETGQRSSVELEQLSTSDPLIILGMDPKIVAMIGGFVTWALHTWKQAEEIRSIRRQVAETNDLKDIEELLEKRVEEVVRRRIEEKTEEITSIAQKSEDAEIVNMTSRTLRMMLERVERGYKVHLRLPPPPQILDDNMAVDEAEDMERLYQVQSELSFPDVKEKPILALSKPENAEE